MLVECGSGGTINIPTNFYWFLSPYEIQCRCLEYGVRGIADPFTDSYLLNGEQEESDDTEEEEQEEEDKWTDTDYTLSGDLLDD